MAFMTILRLVSISADEIRAAASSSPASDVTLGPQAADTTSYPDCEKKCGYNVRRKTSFINGGA
jgi:hypothetical protein